MTWYRFGEWILRRRFLDAVSAESDIFGHRRGLERLGLRLHLQLLRYRRRVHDDALRHGLADRDHQRLHCDRIEALLLHPQGVAADRQTGDAEESVVLRLQGAGGAGRLRSQAQTDAGQRRSGGIHHHALQVSGGGRLTAEGRGEQRN